MYSVIVKRTKIDFSDLITLTYSLYTKLSYDYVLTLYVFKPFRRLR